MSAARDEFLRELQRVLDGEGTVSASFFETTGPLDEAQLAALARWLRTLPTGLGEARLVRALHEWLGPHLGGAS